MQAKACETQTASEHNTACKGLLMALNPNRSGDSIILGTFAHPKICVGLHISRQKPNIELADNRLKRALPIPAK